MRKVKSIFKKAIVLAIILATATIATAQIYQYYGNIEGTQKVTGNIFLDGFVAKETYINESFDAYSGETIIFNHTILANKQKDVKFNITADSGIIVEVLFDNISITEKTLLKGQLYNFTTRYTIHDLYIGNMTTSIKIIP